MHATIHRLVRTAASVFLTLVALRKVMRVCSTRESQPAGIVLVGVHYDTLQGTPGASDNATGIAAMLVQASRLSLSTRKSKPVLCRP